MFFELTGTEFLALDCVLPGNTKVDKIRRKILNALMQEMLAIPPDTAAVSWSRKKQISENILLVSLEKFFGCFLFIFFVCIYIYLCLHGYSGRC